MNRPEMRELLAFVDVARQLNFTRAAATLGVSGATFSQTLPGLEEKIGVRLLTRATRSVSLTDAGLEFLASLEPILEGLNTAVDGVVASNYFAPCLPPQLRRLPTRACGTIGERGGCERAHARRACRPVFRSRKGDRE